MNVTRLAVELDTPVSRNDVRTTVRHVWIGFENGDVYVSWSKKADEPCVVVALGHLLAALGRVA